MDRMKIAKTLLELRGAKTQKMVAEAVGIGTTALSMYENGDRIPRDDIKVRIAKYYDKEVQDIFFN